MLDECNANQITLARSRHFVIYLSFKFSLALRQCIIRISVYCLHFPLDHCFQNNLASTLRQLASALALRSVAS